MTILCLLVLAWALVRMKSAKTWHAYYTAVDTWFMTTAALPPALLMDAFLVLCIYGGTR